MNINVFISVQVPDRNKVGSFRELYRNTVVFDNSLEFPYSKVLDVMRILYPNPDIIVNFRIA